MDEEHNKVIKKIITEHVKSVVSEKQLIEHNLNHDLEENDENRKTVKPIGYVKDFKSEYKNEFFDEIFEDEDGNIIDLRFYSSRPDEEFMEKMSEYWLELMETFKKPVIPFFVCGG